MLQIKNKIGFSMIELLFTMIFTMMIIGTMMMFFSHNQRWRTEFLFIQNFLGESQSLQQNYANTNQLLSYDTIHNQFSMSSHYLDAYNTNHDLSSNANMFMTQIGVLSVLAHNDNNNISHYTLKYDNVNQGNCSAIVDAIMNSRQNMSNDNPFYKYDIVVNQVEFEPITSSKITHVKTSSICQNDSNTLSFSN